jgi:chromosome partitioning protein
MRKTFAITDDCVYRLKAAAALLGISENTLRSYIKDSGIDANIKRQSAENPLAPAVRIFSLENIFQLAAWRREKGLVKEASSSPVYIAVEIIKGGVGKSTTAAELGIQLQLSGFKVLMIDLDVQASLTQLMGYESDLEQTEAEAHDLDLEAIINGTFLDLVKPFTENTRPGPIRMEDASQFIKYPFGAYGPALIPADTYLGVLEHVINATRDREIVFRSFFEASSEGRIPGLNVNDYDFVLFDCPPSVSFTASNAIAAADYVVAPVKMDSFGIKGVSLLINEINIIERKVKQRPDLIILPTHYSTNIARVLRMLQRLQDYKESMPNLNISASELFPRSQEYYLPLTLQQPTAAPVKEYRNFTDYIIERVMTKQAAMNKRELKA